MAKTSVSYRDMRAGIIAYNQAVLDGKKPKADKAVAQLLEEGNLTTAKNGLLQGEKKWFKGLQEGTAEAKAVAAALQKGFEMAHGDKPAKTEKAPKAEKPAKEEKEEPKGPKFNPEVVVAALHKANATGIDSLTEVEKTMVAVQPAERQQRFETVVDGVKKFAPATKDGVPVMEPNPHAGKIGLTPACYQSIMGVINSYPKRLANREKISAAEADRMTATLAAATEARDAAQKSMGITPKGKEIEKEAVAPSQE